jgi:hypothetical protein
MPPLLKLLLTLNVFKNYPPDLSSETSSPFPLTSVRVSVKSPYGRFSFKNLLENSHRP